MGKDKIVRGEMKMKTKELLERIEKIFSDKLSQKSGWGKNEVLVAYKDSVKEALMEELE